MPLSQTQVVDYTVKWLESQAWEIIFAHYPEGHHISPKYGHLKVIKRKFVDVVAKKGACLFLIQCNRRFKASYFEKLRKIKEKDIPDIEFDILLRGVAFNVIPSVKERIKVVERGGLVLEIKGENRVTMYGRLPMICEGGDK